MVTHSNDLEDGTETWRASITEVVKIPNRRGGKNNSALQHRRNDQAGGSQADQLLEEISTSRCHRRYLSVK